MKRDCITLVRSIFRANKTKEKELYLEQFPDEFEVLKPKLRLCKDLRLITIKQQAAACACYGKDRKTDNRAAECTA